VGTVGRDSWLEGGARKRAQILKAAVQAKGQLEPASDHAYRMLVTAPGAVKITDWGGGKDPDGRVTVIKKAALELPESRQLRDPFTTFYVQGIALEPPLPLDRMLNLTEENTLHSACLMAKATDACGRGWEFSPREGKEADEELVESTLPEELKEHVAGLTPELTFSEMLYQAAWEMDSLGFAVWEVVRADAAAGEFGEIEAIYPVPSHTIRASLDPRKWLQIRAGRIRYFKKFGAKCTIDNEMGQVYDWKKRADAARADELNVNQVASELIIFKTYTPRSLWYGVPKWVSAIATIAEMTAIREFNVSWFASGGQTDYAMHFKAETMKVALEMADQVKQQLKENAGRGHTLLITSGTAATDVAVNKLGELLREGHFRFRRGDLAKEVLIAHTVPPYRVGWAETGALGGSNAEEMLNAYRFGAIEPIQVVIEERLTQTLFDSETGIKTGDFRFRLADLDLDDAAESDRVVKQVQFGIVTPNQGREALGLEVDEERPEMDEYYYQGQPLGQAPPDPFGGGGMPGGAPPFGAEPGAEPGAETTVGEPGAAEAAQPQPGKTGPPVAARRPLKNSRRPVAMSMRTWSDYAKRKREAKLARPSFRRSIERFEALLKDALAPEVK